MEIGDFSLWKLWNLTAVEAGFGNHFVNEKEGRKIFE